MNQLTVDLVTHTVCGRYQRYRWYQRHHLRPSDDNWDSNYQNFYQVNKCLGGCSPNSHCEWGVCECDEGFKRAWGACHNLVGGSPPNPSPLSPQNATSLPEPPKPQNQAPACSKSQECFGRDMNMVCR